jgi:oligopeptide/dipeptide ABC transporter ATP-binding protein
MDVIRVEDLRVTYRERRRTVVAADRVSFSLQRGRTLALVGESGCGKTTVALTMLDLLMKPGEIESGRVLLEGRDVLRMPPEELRRVRGAEISLIVQDPVAGLNPVLPIGVQVEEMVRAHREVSKQEARAMAAEALRAQRLDPARTMEAFPFQLSGGMCQRVMFAMATILRPKVIIADEPTSALDVTVQASVLHALGELKRETGSAIVLITHDFGVVAQMADDVAVMYAGRIVEQAEVTELFAQPAHPYTAALLAARPRLDRDGEPLRPIQGTPPDLAELTGECAFLPRCSKAISACRTDPWPPMRELAHAHAAACFNPMHQYAEA